jgi:16S rRNA (adenine1518-N6/adenine1519-N6)-dimethyltransferase
VIRLRPRPFVPATREPERLEALVTRAFATRRKMLKNCLKGWVEEDRLRAALGDLGVSEAVRAEELSVEQFVALADRLGAPPPTAPEGGAPTEGQQEGQQEGERS